MNMKQLDLFNDIAMAYANQDEMDNKTLYKIVAEKCNISQDEMDKTEATPGGHKRSRIKNKIRWFQQELKHMGLLEKVENKKSYWRLTKEGRAKVELKKIDTNFQMLAFSTKLGIAIWGDARKIFEKSKEPIHLMLSSPPYPLKMLEHTYT